MKKIISILMLMLILLSTTIFATSGTIKADKGLILRKEATKTGAVITTIPNNTKVEIIEKTGEWYKVKYNNQEGYVFHEYLKPDETEKEIPQKVDKPITENTVKPIAGAEIHIIPLISSMIIGDIPEGTTDVKIEQEVGKWLYVNVNGIKGWVRRYKIKGPEGKIEEPENKPTEEPTTKPTEKPIKFPTKGHIKVDSAYIREKPTTGSKAVGTLLNGTRVEILEQTGEWYKISYQDRIFGYIRSDLITIE